MLHLTRSTEGFDSTGTNRQWLREQKKMTQERTSSLRNSSENCQTKVT
jgi:hypothetical protein